MRNRTSASILSAAALLAASAMVGCTSAPPRSDPPQQASDNPLTPPGVMVDPNDKLGQPGDADTTKFDNGTFLNGGL